MYGTQPWFDARLARRFATVGVACIGFIIVSLIHAPAVSGQVSPGEIQVSVVPEPGVEARERIDERMPRGLSWEDKRQRLVEEGVRGLPDRPTEFTLTPQQPWRNPGGYLSGWPSNWKTQPGGSSAPTGLLQVDSRHGVRVGLRGLRPNTQYLLDLSVVIGINQALNVVGRCGFASASPVLSTFHGTSGSQHVFVVLPTDASGNSCITLRWSASGSFYQVEISELGPVP